MKHFSVSYTKHERKKRRERESVRKKEKKRGGGDAACTNVSFLISAPRLHTGNWCTSVRAAGYPCYVHACVYVYLRVRHCFWCSKYLSSEGTDTGKRRGVVGTRLSFVLASSTPGQAHVWVCAGWRFADGLARRTRTTRGFLGFVCACFCVSSAPPGLCRR